MRAMQVKRTGDAASTLYNLGYFPVKETSYGIYVNDVLKAETTDYTIDLDSGDVVFNNAPGAVEVRAEFKYAHWRDNNWNLAISNAIEDLNARGFFRQVVRNKTIMAISANVREYSGPSACIDIYEALRFSDRTISGFYRALHGNWNYQQDANKLVLGWKPSVAEKLAVSYLRNLQTYSATSATLDVLNDWMILVKKKAGAQFYRFLAGKIATQGNANIDEGHFSFTNLRTQARDLDEEANILSIRKKPTRPAKPMQYHVDGIIP